MPDDGRLAAFTDDLDGQALGSQEGCHLFGAAVDVGLVVAVERLERHARDPGEFLEVVAQLRQQLTHASADGSDVVGGHSVVGHRCETSDLRRKLAGRHTLSPVLWRKKNETTPADAMSAAHPPRPGAKNRPTPKRRDAQAANRVPLVQTDRKAARASEREARRAQAVATRTAMMTGDESKMPVRDRGADRRYIRNFVDARFNLGEILLPIMLLSLLLSFVRESWALLTVFVLVYGMIAICLIDAFLMWRKLKSQLIAKFGVDKLQRGNVMYAVMRAFQMRRGRLPRPQVKRGEYPS